MKKQKQSTEKLLTELSSNTEDTETGEKLTRINKSLDYTTIERGGTNKKRKNQTYYFSIKESLTFIAFLRDNYYYLRHVSQVEDIQLEIKCFHYPSSIKA